MGTTVVAALLREEMLVIAHVGDSRLYLVRNGTIQALTTDHSWVAEQILKGFITEEEAERSPQRNIVTKALGVESSVDVELTEVPVKSGDILLLCSDGLTRGVHPNDMLHILSGSEDLPAMSDRLIVMANEAGGDDNTTVVVVALQDELQGGLWERLKNDSSRNESEGPCIGGDTMPETLPQAATLLVKLHGQGSRHIELTHETLTIGRKADNTLVIEDAAVSAHHARIVKVQAVFFLEDLMSTNGTTINGRPITRHQLHDADVIAIGQHRLVFQENAVASTAAPTPFVDLDRTTVLRGTDRTPDGPTLTVKVLVIEGKTDKAEYPLTKQVNVIGSQDEAVIRLTGWFAPKSAATIARRGHSYSISPSKGAKSLLVNGTDVVGQQDLKDGDQIEVAGVTLRFSCTQQTKNIPR